MGSGRDSWESLLEKRIFKSAYLILDHLITANIRRHEYDYINQYDENCQGKLKLLLTFERLAKTELRFS